MLRFHQLTRVYTYVFRFVCVYCVYVGEIRTNVDENENDAYDAAW